MKVVTVLFLNVCILLLACNGSKDEKTVSKDEYQKTKQTLADKEKSSPATFLKVSGSDKHNLIGQTVVKGEITNTAVATTFKDVEVKLEFFSKTGTKLETDKETVFEVIPPGKSAKFKTKYFAPKGSDSVSLAVITAKVQN